jgi:hypothetical protein
MKAVIVHHFGSRTPPMITDRVPDTLSALSKQTVLVAETTIYATATWLRPHLLLARVLRWPVPRFLEVLVPLPMSTRRMNVAEASVGAPVDRRTGPLPSELLLYPGGVVHSCLQTSI